MCRCSTMFPWIMISLAVFSASGEDAGLVFEFVGDWGEELLPGQEYVAQAMGDWAARHMPSFIVSGGDNFYPWGVYSPRDERFEYSWREVYTHPAISALTWYISLGNHDYGDVHNEWNQVHFGAAEPRWHLPHLWYDFRRPVGGGKDAHFLVFDTEAWRKGNNVTEQEQWFEETLATSDAHWKIVVGHRPVFSAGNYGPVTRSLHDYFTPLFSRHHVDVYLCGHDHNLQHIRPLGGAQGTDYVINGAGGALWYGHEQEAERRLREEYGMGLEFFEMDWGFVGVSVTEEAIKAEYVDSEGRSLYSFTRQHEV